jgi:uncharacterized protein (TIGR02058 family)
MTRLILEMGMGNDLYGEDYTKAACRAVQDALHHSSLTLFSSLNINHEKMIVNVTIAVKEPDLVDKRLVALELPRGKIMVTVVEGGLNISDTMSRKCHIIASAGIEAFVQIDKEKWKIKN